MVSVKPKQQKNMKPKPKQIEKSKPKKEVVIVSKKPRVKDIHEMVENKTVKLTEPAKKKVKYVMPSKSIKEDLVKASLKALQQMAAHYTKKNTIFEDESPIFAEIKPIKIQNSKGSLKFVLPHSTVASTGEVCLITADLKKGRKPDHEPTIDHWEEILRKAGVTSVKTILPMRQLRVEYDQFELKRRLLTQHDFIMVDTRVINHVSHLLGKMFFKKHNMIIPVRLHEGANIKEDIDTGLRTVMLRLSEGTTSTITVGHTAMSQNELKENVMSLVQQLHERFPGGEANIRSISLKLPLSLSLPLFLTLRPSNTVTAPKLKHKKPKNFAVLEDELTTIPGSTVRVAPDGTVHVKKSKKNETDESDVENEAQDEDDAGATLSQPDNSDSE